MVKHDRRKQLAGADAVQIAQAAELQGIAQPGRWSACDTDRGQVFCVEAMMSPTIVSVSGSASSAARCRSVIGMRAGMFDPPKTSCLLLT